MAEQRRAPRRKSFLRALVYFDGGATPVDCLVRDISDTGARLKLPNRHLREGGFDLTIPISGKKFKGVVQWQLDDEIGVAFQAAGAASHPEKGAARPGADGRSAKAGDNAATPVLVVDDSRTTARAISELLKKLEFSDVDIAEDGPAALKKLHEKRYGLVLSDWEMVPMSGEELLKEMRRDTRTGKIPVILISAKATRGASWLAGASAFLPKPFTENDLKVAVKRVFYLNS